MLNIDDTTGTEIIWVDKGKGDLILRSSNTDALRLLDIVLLRESPPTMLFQIDQNMYNIM